MSSHHGFRGGFTLLEVGLVIIVVVLIACIGIGLMPTGRSGSHERNASTSLKTLSSAQADFRANDRDWNKVNDFWTANVSGLYTVTSAAVAGATPNSTVDPSVKLIELSVASADANAVFYPAGGENVPLSSFAVPSAKAGYWYAAMTSDLQAKEAYRQDTGGTPKMGTCHHLTKFGFVSFPDSLSAGKYSYIVNENNRIYRRVETKPVKSGTLNPPGLGNIPVDLLNWPTDAPMKSMWSKLD